MVRTLVAGRVLKLLQELDDLSTAHTKKLYEIDKDLSPIKKAIATELDPTTLIRILSIKERLAFLDALFKDSHGNKV